MNRPARSRIAREHLCDQTGSTLSIPKKTDKGQRPIGPTKANLRRKDMMRVLRHRFRVASPHFIRTAAGKGLE